MNKQVTLFGRVVVTGYLRAVTGLHIGKGKEGIAIGGVDNPVMRDPLSNEPYIPGSSLKGKLRSLSEKSIPGLRFNYPRRARAQIHACENEEEYLQCPVCNLFGAPGERQFLTFPTRLIVRDTRLEQSSLQRLREADTDLPFTEVKYEATIDRVTSVANPRPLERVPADSVFGPFEMIVNIYKQEDVALLRNLFAAMRLLEDDYLGGSGSRGSGQVRFEDLRVQLKPIAAYEDPELPLTSFLDLPRLSDLQNKQEQIIESAGEVFFSSRNSQEG